MQLLIIMAGIVLFAAKAVASDVESAYVGKGRVYAQTNALSPPVLKPSPYIFEVAVRATEFSALDGAAWSQPPFPGPGAWRFISPSGKTPLFWSWIEHITSQATLDGAHPNGDYYIRLDTAHDGIRTNHILLSGSTYPNPPRITNYDSAQSIDPAADFTVQWAAFTGGTANDLIIFTVLEATNGTGVVFQTGQFPGAASTLDGTRTSVTLPAGTLAPARVYLGRLRFEKVVSVDRTNYSSEVGFAGYFAATDFYLATAGADSNTAPRIISVYPAPGAVDVPRDAALIWTFNKPMQRASGYSMNFTVDRTSLWTTDRRSFVLLPETPEPAATNKNWRLQPWRHFVLFGDLLGNPLFTDINGTFTTGNDLLPPPAQPKLGMPRVGTNAVEMLLHGESNRLYAVQVSTDLANWTSFSTNVPASGSVLVTHSPPASSTPARFYRALVLY